MFYSSSPKTGNNPNVFSRFMDKQLWYFHTTKYYLEIKTHALFFFFFGHVACGILVLQPGLSPVASAVEAQSLN